MELPPFSLINYNIPIENVTVLKNIYNKDSFLPDCF